MSIYTKTLGVTGCLASGAMIKSGLHSASEGNVAAAAVKVGLGVAGFAVIQLAVVLTNSIQGAASGAVDAATSGMKDAVDGFAERVQK